MVTLAEWEATEGEFAEEKEEEMEEDVEEDPEETQEEFAKNADEGEMLVIQRVMSTQRVAKDEQRENIFHSRCIV